MKGRILIGLLLVFLITGLDQFATLATLPSSSVIRVPEDYLTIQEAINAAKPGDTILVAPGIYYESITIAKPISLIGENKENTMIRGLGTGDVVYISSDGVKISGFTIKGSGTRYIGPFNEGDSGIELNHVTNCTVSNLIVAGNTLGISLIFCKNIVITNNLVISNRREGIFMVSSSNSLVINNTSNSNGGHGGIWLALSSNNIIISNIANFNPDHGIKLHTSNSNTVENNTCSFNGNGIFLFNAYDNKVINNNCSRNRDIGIFLRCSEDNIVANNTCKFNGGHGISLDFLNYNNTVKNNVLLNNRGNGITLRLSSSHNRVIGNIAILNGKGDEGAGVCIEYSDNNEISFNVLLMNTHGIMVEPRHAIQWDEFMEKYKDEVKAKATRGIKILSENSAGNRINNNIIEGNTRGGILNKVQTEVDATNNWWGDPSGPHHPTLNPNGKGDKVSGNVLFKPWLTAPIESLGAPMLRLSNLSIVPAVAKINETINISVNATNVGDLPGTFTVTLKLNGVLVNSKTVSLKGGESTVVTFQVISDKAGTFDVEVNGLKGIFTVKQAQLPWASFAIIFAVVVIAASIIIIMFTKKYRLL